MFDTFVWIFEHGLLLFTVIVLLYSAMFGYEYIVMFGRFLKAEVVPYFFPRYKQTHIILVEMECARRRFVVWSLLILCSFNLLLTFLNAVLLDVYHPANLLIGLFCLYSAARNAKVLGRHEQDLCDALGSSKYYGGIAWKEHKST